MYKYSYKEHYNTNHRSLLIFMRVLSDAAVHPLRIVLPVVDSFPDTPITGEIIYFNRSPHQAMMLYTGEGWVPLYTTRNNIWERHIAEPEQKVFDLSNEYDTDGNSLVVYKDGRRLLPHMYAEVGRSIVTYKEVDEETGEDIELHGGEEFEFQIFNVRKSGTFNVKSFNRRVGVDV